MMPFGGHFRLLVYTRITRLFGNPVCCSRVLDGRSEVGDLDLVDHEAHGSAYAEMLAHDVVVEACKVGEFGHTSQSSRLGLMVTRQR